ncbi:hypothetical protein ACGFYY_25185 [Streptomyces sp. NPDC048331]|uniref:hypothetical protein n=1 Tax=Streptomyces sp. NPDC048331 TaxID=3365534 RepID=UPI003713EFE9
MTTLPWTLRTPGLVYAASDGDTFTAIDVMAVTDPRERVICRALLQHTLALLDAAEPCTTTGSSR